MKRKHTAAETHSSVFMQNTVGLFLEGLIKIYAIIPTYALQLDMQNSSSLFPFFLSPTSALIPALSSSLRVLMYCAQLTSSRYFLLLFSPTHTHTPLLLMNEWEKTLISIMCCSCFSVPLKQSLLFSPRSPSLTQAYTLVGD